jgi:hypothetical protein
MSGRGRIAIVVGALAAVVVLFLVFRPGGDDEEAAPATTSPTPTPTAVAPSTTPTTETVETEPPAPPPPPPGPPPPVQARIVIRGGEVVGGTRVFKVKQDRQVVLIVRSDVADHVHLHGYDLMADVGPGTVGRIRFESSITGRFEIELEDRGLPIGELQVRP